MSETERFEIVRSLGRDSGTFVARDKEAHGRLVVVERVKRATLSPENAAALLRRMRLLATAPHPCVERVREPIESDETITVVTDFVDGEWLAALKDAKPRPSLEVLLRILLDAMRGLAALLELEDSKGDLAPVVHGALSPESILVTPQGTTMVARFARGVPRLADLRTDAAYVPFEVLRGRRAADERTDVYSVGAMLWESLTGERPLAGLSLSEIIETATETRVPPARVPASAPWAEPLAEIAWRALALDADERQRDTIAVAAEVRRIAGARVADPLAVEEFMKSVGAVVRVRERRASLERGDEEAVPVSSSQLISESDIQVVPMPPIPSHRPKPTPPPLRAASVAPREAAAAPEAVETHEAQEPHEPAAAAPEAPSGTPSVEVPAAPAVPALAVPEQIPRDLPSTERASLEEVWSYPPKLPTPLPILVRPKRDTSQVNHAPSVEAAEAQSDSEHEAWQRRQPTVRPKTRPVRPASEARQEPASSPPRRRSPNRSWMVAALAATLGLGWWLGRRSAETETSLTKSAHAGDSVPTASAGSSASTAAATTVADMATASPDEHPTSTAGVAAATATTMATAMGTTATMATLRPIPTFATTGTGVATAKPAGSAPPRTVVTVEPNPSPPKPSADTTAKPEATANPDTTTAPPKPKSFDPNEP